MDNKWTAADANGKQILQPEARASRRFFVHAGRADSRPFFGLSIVRVASSRVSRVELNPFPAHVTASQPFHACFQLPQHEILVAATATGEEAAVTGVDATPCMSRCIIFSKYQTIRPDTCCYSSL